MQSFHSRRRWRSPAAGLAGLLLAAAAQAQITFYESEGFEGRSLTAQGDLQNLTRNGFNDRASSAVVRSGRWEICEDARFQGRCTVLRPGQYASLSSMGLNDRVSSVRRVSERSPVDEDRYAPHPVVAQDYRRRDEERVFEAPVLTVRAVFGPPEQRCWTEREQVNTERNDSRVSGGVIGAVIGGILGHQIGGGTGRDIATAGGAVAGAVVGSNLGRDRSAPTTTTRDVQRCSETPAQARPAYWDVTYEFRGQQHQVQLTTLPGPSITVNSRGEPRA
jgi:uncharacterized protein YcfJ